MSSKVQVGPANQRLDSWKEIAAFLGRGERTVKRWEKERGLPVHHIPGGARGSVYAYAEELAAWLNTRRDLKSTEPSKQQSQNAGDRIAQPGAKRAYAGWTNGFAAQFWNVRGWFRSGLVVLTAAAVLLIGIAVVTAFQSRRTGAAAVALQSKLRVSQAESTAGLTAREQQNILVASPGYGSYLRARESLAKRNRQDLQRAEQYFGEAIKADPNLAPAYAGLAESYTLGLLYGLPVRSEQARAAAQKALQINPDLAEAHTALGGIDAVFDWDWQGADHEFQRAIQLDPDYVLAHHWYATLCLAPLGRLDHALAEIEQAQKLDPGSNVIRTDLGFIYYLRGQYRESASTFQAVLQADPNFVPAHYWLAELDTQVGSYGESYQESMAAFHLTRPSSPLEDRGMRNAEQAYRSSGYSGFVHSVLTIDLESNPIPNRTYVAARAHFLLGDYDKAIRGFSAAADDRDPAMLYVGVDPRYKILRSDAVFEDVLRRMGLRRN